MKNNAVLFSLTANVELTKKISEILNVPIGQNEVVHFADGEIIVENATTVRGKNVYVIQSTCPPVTERLFEVLIFIDALRRASAKEINLIMPYYGYSRQDRKANPREPITARLVADMLQGAGVTHVMVMDLHAPQIQGFFNCPIDDLSAMPLFANHFADLVDTSKIVVVSPDHGGVTRARRFASYFDNAPIAIIDKRRPAANVIDQMTVIGDVKDRIAIIVDDIVDTASTLSRAAGVLIDAGATKVYAAASHAVLSRNAVELINGSKLEQLVVTDSIPLMENKKSPRIAVVSIAPLIAQAIKLIEERGSLGTVYSQFNKRGLI